MRMLSLYVLPSPAHAHAHHTGHPARVQAKQRIPPVLMQLEDPDEDRRAAMAQSGTALSTITVCPQRVLCAQACCAQQAHVRAAHLDHG